MKGITTMIQSPQNACMSCFTQHAAPTNPCPVCGYDEATQELPPHILRPRTILNGKYLIGKVLGQGGFGITYIGWDLNLGIKVAIKEYYPSGFVSRETTSVGNATVQPFTGSQGDFFLKGREKFINEARTLAKFFALPGIVSIKDFFQENGTAYISMEFIDGQTLKDYLSQMGGRLPAGQIFEMMKPVMSSLAEIHNAGLIHRDISPDNIMISKEGQMKLLDFGAARDFSDSGNKSMSIMLKPGFAPEEQYRTRGVQGPWTDVYALSATIYRCITGVTPEESVERTRRDEVRPPSMLGVAIDPAQEAALMRGMAVLQEYRFQNVSELYASLYGQQTAPVAVHTSATTQPTAVPVPHVPHAPQLYQQPVDPSQQPLQQYQQPMQPSQQQYQQPADSSQQQYPQQYQQHQQPHNTYYQPSQPLQQPHTSAQMSQEKPGFSGWLKKHKVPVGICSAAAILLIVLGIMFLSDSPSGNPPVSPDDDVIVTASPPPTAEPEPEPTPIHAGIDGTWVMRGQDGYTAEFAFNMVSNRFYMVLFESSGDEPENFIVVEGTFSVSGDNLSLSSQWGAEADDDLILAVDIDEQWNFTFSLSGQTLTIFDEDGLPEVYTGGQTLGVWSFNHRETATITEYVEDMPYTVVYPFVSIPGYFTGLWANGMPNGFGVFINGESGEIDDNMHFTEGASITGTFVNGLVEGFGEFECLTTGSHFIGDHVNGLRSGFGIYTWSNGDVYVGYWENNRMNGEGTITHPEDGYSMEAFWIDGEAVGDVVITLDDGTIYDGVIEDGELISLTER